MQDQQKFDGPISVHTRVTSCIHRRLKMMSIALDFEAFLGRLGDPYFAK